MKKFISLILVMIMTVSLTAGIVTAYDRGDCDEDGQVNNKDVVTLFRAVSTANFQYPDYFDINEDGQVNNKDVVELFRQVSTLAKDCEHEYKSETTIEATCEHEGEETYTCEKCGWSYTLSIPKTAHFWSGWEVVKEATTEEYGLAVRHCTICGSEEQKVLEKLPPEETGSEENNPESWEGTYTIDFLNDRPDCVEYYVVFKEVEDAYYGVFDFRKTWGTPPELIRTGENEVTVNWIGINGEKLQVVMDGFDPQIMMGADLYLYEDGTYKWLYISAGGAG